MADINYYEVFGVEAPEEQGEKGAPVAEAQTETEDIEQGGKEHEDADRAVDTEEPAEAGKEEGDDEPKEQKQSDEDNAHFAKMRREAEASAQEKANTQRDREIAAMGLTDDDGRPIATLEQLARHNAARAQKQSAAYEREEVERYVDMGLSEDEAREVVAAKVEARRVKELEARLGEIEERERQATFEAKVTEELAMIAEYEPTIKTVDDLAKMDNFEEFARFVGEGDNYITAYLRSHRGKRPQQAQPEAANVAADKSHLRATQTRGGGGIDVPDSVIAEYRIFNPDATRAEIEKHYRKSVKKS